jgi:hypothetical protein
LGEHDAGKVVGKLNVLKRHWIARLHFYGDLSARPIVRCLFWRSKDEPAFGPKGLLKGRSYAIACPTDLSFHFPA